MPATPRLPVPPGACDTHMHLYADHYPRAAGTKPPPAGADVAAYRKVMARLGLQRVVVVQPAAYGTDNACTLDAVAELGDCARAVVVVTPTTSEAELARLHAAGARGARFFMMAGAPQGWDAAPVAARIAPLGWHVQLQFDGTELPEREAAIRALPCTGRHRPSWPLSSARTAGTRARAGPAAAAGERPGLAEGQRALQRLAQRPAGLCRCHRHRPRGDRHRAGPRGLGQQLATPEPAGLADR